jgi:hypothetical protein
LRYDGFVELKPRPALLVAIPTVALLLFFGLRRSPVSRFLQVSDSEMRSHGVVFDTVTGKNCSIHSYKSKELQELRQTFLARKRGEKIPDDKDTRYSAFTEQAKTNEEAYGDEAYYIIYGSCPR